MEKLITIVLLAISAVFVILLIKKYAPEYAVAASVCISCVIIFFIVTEFGGIINDIMEFVREGNLSGQWANSVVKVSAISFIGQWGIGICRDAGENSIADKLEMVVKIMILIICMPYIKMIFSVAKEIN